jgi:probable F420-dependent oxidoreductase
MKFGVGLPNYGPHTSFDAIRRVALAAEELGYDSVWTTDHVIVPKEHIEPYGHIYESVVTLAMVASVTQRVRLGTSIIVLPMRNPVLFAKQAATIDAASGGRMIVGVGVGWNEPEYKNLSADFKNRGKRLDEDITLLRALWSSENANFHGKYTQITDSIFAPLPARKEIPIWIGGNGEPSWRRAAALGDAWHATGAPPEGVAAAVQYFREHTPARRLLISARLNINLDPNVPPTYEYRGAPRRRLSGTDDDVRATLREYVQAGLQHAALWFPIDDITVTLDQMQRFMRDIAPGFAS